MKASLRNHRSQRAFTLVEVMVATAISAMMLAGVMTFVNFSSLSVSGVIAQNKLNYQAGTAIEFIQQKTLLATSIVGDATGNSITFTMDDNFLVDSNNDGKPYNDKDHAERFVFVGFTTTNAGLSMTNKILYYPNTNSSTHRVLVPRGVRSLPSSRIFTVTNNNTVVIRFGIAEIYGKKNFQSIDIQGTALALNRPATNTLISILP